MNYRILLAVVYVGALFFTIALCRAAKRADQALQNRNSTSRDDGVDSLPEQADIRGDHGFRKYVSRR